MARANVNSEFAVIGLSRFGVAVARTLTEHGYTVLGIDGNIQVVQAFADDITQTVALDSADEDALRAVDIALYPVVVVSIDADFHKKILTTLALKSLGTRRVICVAADESEKTVLLKVGADDVVMPEYDSGRRLAIALATPSLTDHLQLGRGFAVSEVRLPPSFVGKSAGEDDLRKSLGLALVAVCRGDDVIVSPPADFVYQAGDQLVLIGKVSDLDRLGELA